MRNKAIFKTGGSVLLVLWIIAYFALFMTKGIYINDNFYKKRPNIKNITYTAVSQKALPKNIVLNKNIDDTATLTIDGELVVISNIKTTFDGAIDSFTVDGYTQGTDVLGIPYNDVGKIVTQELEDNRGNMAYFIIVIILIAISIILKYNSEKLFYLVKKDKAPTENYYKILDNFMWVTIVVGVLFLTLTL